MSKNNQFEHKVIYFFIPLAENISLPDGFQVPIAPDYLSGRSIVDYIYIEGVSFPIEYSLVFRQFNYDARAEGFDEALEAATKYTPESKKIPTAESINFNGQITVVEVMCLVDEFSNKAANQAFTKAVTHINTFINAYFESTHMPNNLLSEAKLPPAIPFIQRTITEKSTKNVADGELGLYAVNLTANGIHNLKQRDLSKEELTSLPATFERASSGLLDVYNNIRREAELEVRDGNRVTAVILYESSIEVLLRELLLFLYWEEDTDPSVASWVIAEHDLNNILLVIQEKLGGNWSRSKAGAVKKWTTELALLRDAVVHAGYSPTNQELDDAVSAFHDLVKYIANRVSVKWEKFPLTCNNFIGLKSVKTRLGDKYPLLEALLGEIQVPSSVPKHYANWKYEVNRNLGGKKAWSSTTKNCQIVHLAYPTGEGLWWLLDRDKKLARRAKDPRIDSLSELAAKQIQMSVDKQIPLSTLVEDVSIKPRPLSGDNTWYEAYKILPLFEIGRWPQEWHTFEKHQDLK